ncbi:MAG TPA: hypothetical protein VIT91_19885 [Chthoniobacterales bacterium]
MAHFDKKSRYVRFATMLEATDRRGRKVQFLTPAVPAVQTQLGEHLLRQGQRLDHLASHYLGDPNGFWQIAEINDALLPDAALQGASLKIPRKR